MSAEFLEGLTDVKDSLGFRSLLLLGKLYLWLVCRSEADPTAGWKTFMLEVLVFNNSLLPFLLDIIVVPNPV